LDLRSLMKVRLGHSLTQEEKTDYLLQIVNLCDRPGGGLGIWVHGPSGVV